MSKFISFVLIFLLFFDFFGSAALRVKFAEKAWLALVQEVMVNPVYDENGDLLTYQHGLHWDGRGYEEFGINVNSNISMVGKLFGLTDMRGSSQVFLAVGQKPEEWLICQHGGTMMGFYVLYKEKSVTEIPEDFALLMAE